MKLYTAALTLISFHSSAVYGGTRGGKNKERVYPKVIDITEEECSGEAILALIQDNPHYSEVLRTKSKSEIVSEITGLCHQDHRRRSLQDTQEIPFSYVTGLGRQFDKNYFDGGTDWNVGTDNDSSSKEVRAGRIAAVEGALSTQQLQWPSHIVNFDDSTSCQLRSAMCCFTKRQNPSTGVVSNINDVPSWAAPNIVPNADVCMVHLDRSPQAGHVKTGRTFYSDGRDVEQRTKDAFCTGFSWSANQDDVSTKYRANTLYQISMLNGFYNNDLVGGVPGAPMCGCVEQMPVVSDAECVEPVQTRRLSINVEKQEEKDGSAQERHRLLVDTSITFTPCGKSLVEQYASTNPTSDVNALSKIITGDCVDTVDKYLAPQAYKRGSAWWYADEDQWTTVFGKKFLYHPEMSAEDFMTAFEQSSTKTIRRVCTSCSPSHRDIYYKRLTDVPNSLNLLDMLKDNFSDTDNVLGTDFILYSKDKTGSISANWTFCDYSNLHGFPYQCGPTTTALKQWTSTTKGGTYAKDYAFYIEK